MRIALRQFGGIAPAIDDQALAEEMATIARDCKLSSGKLVPLRENVAVQDLSATGHKSLYRWEYTEHKLTCGAAGNSTAANWVALDTPAFEISIDGTEYQIAPDFDGATDMDDIAEDIQDAIREQTEGLERVLWSTDRFIVYANGDVTSLAAPDDGDAADVSGASWMNGLAAAATLDNDEKESWLTWADHADIVRSSVAADQYSRIYWTGGGGVPQVKGYDAGQVKTYDVAIPKPDKVPIVEAVAPFEFSQWRAYIEKASDGTKVQADVTISDATRDGLDFSFAIQFGTSVRFLRNIEYRVVVEGYCTSLETPAWITCSEAQSFALQGGLQTSWVNYWMEATENSVHTTETYELEGDGNGSKCMLKPEIGMKVIQSADYYNPSDPTEILGMDVTWKAVCKVTLDGTFPQAVQQTFPRYLYAYVTEWGEEGPVSEPSTEITRKIGENVKVWMPVQLPDGGAARGIAKKRVYVTDGNGDWRFCKDVDLDDSDQTATANASLDGTDSDDDGVLTWEYGLDDVAQEALGEVLEPDVQGPDDDLAGLCRLSGGYFAAFKGREVWISLPYRPEAWPEGYRFTFHDKIVTIRPSGNELFVLTEKTPWLLSGSEPQYMTQTQIMHDDRALTARGTVQVRGVVLSPGPDGLSAFAGGSAQMATAGLLDAEAWADFDPDGILAAAQDGAYLGFLSASGFVFDLREGTGALTTTDDAGISAVFRDDEADTLYAIDADGWLTQWNAATGASREFVWRSKEFVLPKAVRWVAAKLRASEYGGKAKLRLYGDGLLRATYVPTDAKARKIPVHGRFHRWQLEVVASTTVYEAAVGTSMAEVPNG